MTDANEELKKVYFGAYSFSETEDGWLQAFQYSDAQMAYFRTGFDFWYDRCMATSAKTLEMITEATRLSLEYRFIWTGSQDSFELMVDGLITRIDYVKDLPEEGCPSWALPAGRKPVVIYLPADATVLLRGFSLNGTAERPEKKEKVLWLGDSITQGYGPPRSYRTYVNVGNGLLHSDIINPGLGG